MLKILEKSFLVFALLYFAGGLIVILQPDYMPQSDEPAAMSGAMMRKADLGSGQDPTQKNKIKIATQVGIYFITAVLIAFNLREFLRLFGRHPWLLMLLAIAVLSTLWSDSPGFTARRSLVLLASTSFGVYLATRYSLREILRLLWIAGVIAAIGSFLIVWRKPEMGIASGATAGDWQGLFGQKNTLGRFMAFEIMAFGVGIISEKGMWRWFCIFGVLLSLPLLIMSKDATAYLALPMLVVLLPMFQYARSHSFIKMAAFLAAAGATAAGIFFVIFMDPEKVLQMMGKNSSLSGRTDIWSMVWDKFLQRPWVGYGYSAFWMGKDGKQSAGIWEALHWAVPHSHNGFLDVLVQVGAVGMAIFVVGYIVFFYNALRCARASKTMLGLFPMVYLSFMILFNCSEGSIIREENMFWVLYAAMWALTTRWLGLAEAAARRAVPAVAAAKKVRPIPVPAWRFGSTN